MSSTTMITKPKTVFQLDSPFTEVRWPDTSKQNQQTILDLLCSTLTPIGQHRSNHVTASKGKRSRKRKREEAKRDPGSSVVVEAPPPPEISSHIMVGLNSITRSLECLSNRSKPQASHSQVSPQNIQTESLQELEKSSSTESSRPPLERHFAAVFVSQSSRPGVLNAHLPQLIATASLAHPESPATRLVQLPGGCDSQLSKALGLPRVSFIGILEDAPHCKALVGLIRDCIAEVEVPWLQEPKQSAYLPVKVRAIETFATVTEKPGKGLKK